MTYTRFNKFVAASALVGGLALGVPAQAGADASGDLYSWSTAAGKSVSSEMKYPAMAILKGSEGTPAYRVTIDRDGDVLSAELVKSSRSGVLNAAAKRAIKRADFPNLPADYRGDKLTFAVKLNYALAYSVKEQKALQRQGRVSSTRIASNGAPVNASVEILEGQAD